MSRPFGTDNRCEVASALMICGTCLTNLALAGVPLNGIKEYAGHASIVETQRYLKFMPESKELAAKVTSRLAELSGATSER
jgi:hypothetical protein